MTTCTLACLLGWLGCLALPPLLGNLSYVCVFFELLCVSLHVEAQRGPPPICFALRLLALLDMCLLPNCLLSNPPRQVKSDKSHFMSNQAEGEGEGGDRQTERERETETETETETHTHSLSHSLSRSLSVCLVCVWFLFASITHALMPAALERPSHPAAAPSHGCHTAQPQQCTTAPRPRAIHRP